MDKIYAMMLILHEHNRAVSKFPPIRSNHEGYAIILEELEELWIEIKAIKDTTQTNDKIKKEAIQLAAMTLRFIVDRTV